jgi:hypothetical protein
MLWTTIAMIQIIGVFLLSYFLLNAYLALWFLYFELFDHYRTNSRRLALLSKAIKLEGINQVFGIVFLAIKTRGRYAGLLCFTLNF